MGTLRTPEGEFKYKKHIADGGLAKGCVLCSERESTEFVYWKIIKNIFPYDKIASSHDMLVPKRHAVEADLTAPERAEFQKIKTDVLFGNYDYLLETAHPKKSVPDHFHLHLVVVKE